MKIMKRICIILAVLISVAAAKAQSFTYEDLELFVNEWNSSLPQSMGPSMEMISVSITPAELILVGNVNELDAEIEQDLLDQLRGNILTIISDEESKEFFSALIDLGISYRIILFGSKSGKTGEVLITPDDMLKIISTETTPQERLNALIASRKSILPVDCGDGIIYTDLRISGNYLEYVYQVPDHKVNSLTPESAKSAIREFLTIDETSKFEARKCVEAGYGMAFIYIGESISLRTQFTAQELLDIGIDYQP